MTHRTDPAPVQVGQELTLEVESLGEGSDGLARVGRFAVFVDGTLPGERVFARIVAVHEAHARAKALRIEEPSADRVEPRCPHVGSCPGCRQQHVSPGARAALALKRLETGLARHLKGDLPQLEVAGEPVDGYAARCRIVLRFARRRGQLEAGMPDFTGRQLLDIEECPATVPGAVAVVRAITAEAIARDLHALRAVVAHASSDGERVQATLVADTARLPHGQRLAEVARDAGATGICLNQHEGRGDRLFGRRTVPLLGRPYLVERTGDLSLRMSATTFFEMTHGSARAMADAVVRAAGPVEGARVVDLFSGSASFSLPLARAGAEVLGVESNRQAIHDAEGSAHDAEIDGVRFVADDVGIHVVALERHRPAVVVADPPAAGCDDATIAGICRLMAPRRIVLVGRDPGTLGRQLVRFGELGFTTTHVAAVETDPLAGKVGGVATLERTPG